MAVGPVARILAQLGVMGFSIASKAFMAAYQQAVHCKCNVMRPAHQPCPLLIPPTCPPTLTLTPFRAAAKQGGGAQAAAQAVARRGKMGAAQAREVLNIEAEVPICLKTVQEQHDRYFAANDPDKGGSFYLQSKIFRAKEALEWEFNEAQREAAQAEAEAEQQAAGQKKSGGDSTTQG